MLFINTRPQDRAKPLTVALQQQSVEVVELPLLELIERPLSSSLIGLYRQLQHAKVIVAVSPTAVDVGMKYLKQLQISLSDLTHIKWIAVGQKTAESLIQYGVESIVPDVETSEGMLNLSVLKSLDTQTEIAFWRGEGGRQFMMDSLTSQGHKILNFILYDRQCPPQSQQAIETIKQRIAQPSGYKMVVSSEASWLNWIELIQNNRDILNQADYWVLGERLFQLLLDYQKQNKLSFKITKLANLKIDSIMQQIAVAQG